jgi:hypothetical protein
VRHDAGGGDHFGRGSARAVVGSDEGGCALAVLGEEGEALGGATYGPGGETTGQGPHVGERGRGGPVGPAKG